MLTMGELVAQERGLDVIRRFAPYDWTRRSHECAASWLPHGLGLRDPLVGLDRELRRSEGVGIVTHLGAERPQVVDCLVGVLEVRPDRLSDAGLIGMVEQSCGDVEP